MHNYQPISRERHGNQRWSRSSNYTFAAHETVVPLIAAELPKAMLSLPIGFTITGGSYVPAAILSLLPGKDLFVALSGSWAGEYIPSAFRAYPFRLLKTDDGQQVLCIDENSGLVSSSPEGERFFNDDGSPAQPILDVLNFVGQMEQNRQVTATACAALQKHQLIRPWTITLNTEDGRQHIEGLFQIDEAALHQLSADALLEVSHAGALLIAYCQLLSMQHLPLLGQMIEAHSKAAAQSQALQQLAPNGELDLEFLNNHGTISFSGLF